MKTSRFKEDRVPYSVCEVLWKKDDIRIVTTSGTFLPGRQKFVTTVTKNDGEEIYPLRKFAYSVGGAEANHIMTIRKLEGYGWGNRSKVSDYQERRRKNAGRKQ